MKVKNGIDSSNWLPAIPKIRSGNAWSKTKSKWPRAIARKPKPNPTADSENATG